MNIEIFDSPEELASAVAGELLNHIADAQASGHVPQIVLTGGGLSRKVHRAVAAAADASGVDWGAVEIWWGDERFVPVDDEERNARQAREDFIDAVMVPPSRVHEIGSSSSFATVEEAAHAYAHEIADHGPERFDVVMLGLGPDGHVASLFPGFPQLEESDHAATSISDSPKPPPARVTLTFPALLNTKELWLMTTGAERAEIIKAVNDGEDLPATRVAAHPAATLFLDRTAAADL